MFHQQQGNLREAGFGNKVAEAFKEGSHASKFIISLTFRWVAHE